MNVFTLDIHIFGYFIAIFLNIAGFIQDIFYCCFVLFYLYFRIYYLYLKYICLQENLFKTDYFLFKKNLFIIAIK